MEINKKPNNPIAFPAHPNTTNELMAGMTLRDYFANSAMLGILSSYVGSNDVYKDINSNSFNISKRSYELADAMLKQREL